MARRTARTTTEWLAQWYRLPKSHGGKVAVILLWWPVAFVLQMMLLGMLAVFLPFYLMMRW
jgi:hypothetical protein